MKKVVSALSFGIPTLLGLRRRRRNKLETSLKLLGGIGLGAGLMYILDPDRCNLRRTIFKNTVVSGINKTGSAISTKSRDLGNRTYGLFANIRSLFSRDRVSDEKLLNRVRSKLGRAVSHPHAIVLTVNDGRVVLSGPILADEVNDLLGVVSRVRGVQFIDNRLEVHEQAGNHPDLQGGIVRRGGRFELFQNNLSPAARVLISAAGGTLATYGFRRNDRIGIGLGVLGLGFALRGITNKKVERFVGLGRHTDD